MLELLKGIDPLQKGREMHALIEELYPICRSITGNGVRRTLQILGSHIPLEVHEVPSGTRVFDWTVPQEWNIRGAYLKGPRGDKVVDFGDCNLHVVNYSEPVCKSLPLEELKAHLHTLPDHPEWIPYKTSYYRRDWGFCLSQRKLETLEKGEYQVVIDATLEPGSLTYGEYFLAGEEEGEVLISCHVCHPSLANDNLSGVSVATFLAKALAAQPKRHLSYRFLFIPGTIGAITWLSLNEALLQRICHGLVLTGLGDPGPLTYKKSRRGAAPIDRAACHVLQHSGGSFQVEEFVPYGYDERQYCSPGFDLPVGRLSRTPYGRYPQYHTSGDNLDFVLPDALGGSLAALLEIVEVLEENSAYLSLNPKCEPQLGKRGLYRSCGVEELALLWVMNLSDGAHSLLEIAERAGTPFRTISRAAHLLCEEGLLRQLPRDREEEGAPWLR